MWHRLEQHWNKTKSFINQGYHTLGKWAGHMDKAANVGKRLFSLAMPALQDMGQDDLIQGGIQAIGRYNDIRSQTQHLHKNISAYGQAIDSADIFS